MSAERRQRPRRSGKQDEDDARLHANEICWLLVSRVKDYAIYVLGVDGQIRSWNDGAEHIKGYRAEEIIGKHMSTFYTPEDIERGLPAELLKIAEAEGRVEREGWRVRKDGTRFWCDVVITALRDDRGKLVGFGKVTRDLTERKAAEDALGELSGRLLKLQDEERRRIASELHDTTSPLLTSLVSKLYSVRVRAGGEGNAFLKDIDESVALAEATANMVRTVSSLLHPPDLDEGGLLASLRWFVDAFPRRTGIKVEAQLPDLMPRLPADHETTLFRLTQDWFNSMQRSGLKAARVRLTMTGDMVQLRIITVMLQSRGELGDLGVLMAANRERLRQLGGRLEVESQGTGITATLPVRGSTRA